MKMTPEQFVKLTPAEQRKVQLRQELESCERFLADHPENLAAQMEHERLLERRRREW